MAACKIYQISFTLLLMSINRVVNQIDYYKDEWPVPFRVWEAIDKHQKVCEQPHEQYYNGTIEKFVVSTYIAHFKYAGVDARLQETKNPNSFQGYFPRPPIDRLDAHLKTACETSSEDCVHHVFLRLNTHLVNPSINQMESIRPNPDQLVSISIQHKSQDVQPLLLFIFKMTAMYYLCYWSILIDNPINEIIWPCRKPGKKLFNPTFGRCMIDAVCPNPCCGDAQVASTDSDCANLSDGVCVKYVNHSLTSCQRLEGHLFYSLVSFRYFFNNGPRFQCQCPATQTWDADVMMCLDEDECLAGRHKCDVETQYCVNRIGGYFCVCQFGFQYQSPFKCLPNT